MLRPSPVNSNSAAFLVLLAAVFSLVPLAPAADSDDVPPLPPEEPLVSVVATAVVSVSYIEFNEREIQRLENQLVAMQEAGEDVSDARALIEAGKNLKGQGLQREADAVFRQAELLLSSSRVNAEAEFGSRLVVVAFLCLLLLALLYLPWQEKIGRFRERLHGPMQENVSSTRKGKR